MVATPDTRQATGISRESLKLRDECDRRIRVGALEPRHRRVDVPDRI
jgi:hypothetical protein